MLYIECSKISGLACEYAAKGDYKEEAAETLLSHMRGRHKEFIENMSARQLEIVKGKIIENLKEYKS